MTEETTTTTAPPAWHAGLQGDDLAHVQSRGWDKFDAGKAAVEAALAHRNAEKVIGIPADQVLRKPKDLSDTANWDKINEVLGVPKDPKDYSFDGVKFADGTDLDDTFREKLRGIVANHKLSKDAAKGIAADLVKLIEEGETVDNTEYTNKLNAEKEVLKVNWGASNYATNLVTAQNAAAKLGVDPEAVAALEKVVGYSKVMEMFREIGTRMGEDRFVKTGGSAGGALTKEQANARLVELRNDSAWVDRYNRGDMAAQQEFNNLTEIVARN